MNRSIGILQSARGVGAAASLCILGIVFAGCAKSDDRAPDNEGDTGGTGGQSAKGGSGGTSAHNGGSLGSGGSSSGGSGGTVPSGGGGTASGGSAEAGSGAGGDTGGSSSGGSAGGSSGGATGGEDAGTGGTSGGEDAHPTNPNNPCFTANIGNDRSLPGLSATDFCDGYEKYCKYTPDGSLMSKCAPGQPVGPLYKSRMDCEMKYMAASAGARACRAGQMCRNGKDGLAMGNTPKGLSLIVNACSHATGYCAGTCK